jgi:hypothetical protein
MFQIIVVEKIRTHILCSISVFRKYFRSWDNVEKYCRAGQATDDTLNSGYPKATNTQSEYVILTAFPQPQWLQKRASMLRCSTLPVFFPRMYARSRALKFNLCWNLNPNRGCNSLVIVWYWQVLLTWNTEKTRSAMASAPRLKSSNYCRKDYKKLILNFII